MEIKFVTKEVKATGEGMDETSINYDGFVSTGLSWLDTVANANIMVKAQGKIRDIMRSDIAQDEKEKKLKELSTMLPENLLGSASFGRSDVENIINGVFAKTLPSINTLADSFIDGIITSKKEFVLVKSLVAKERKKRNAEKK